jgi:hypothetical protein
MKNVSPAFSSDKTTINLFAYDRTKVEVLVNSTTFSSDPDTFLEPTGFRKVWIRTTVGECARMVVNSLEMRDVDGPIFAKVFGWNAAETADSDEYDRLCAELPENWQRLYYEADKAEITVAELVSACYECEESGDQVLAILTPKDARIMRDDAWAKKLQDRAAQFCATQKVDIGTFAFFNALSREIRRLADKRDSYFGGEQSAERYATYRACGSGSYWSDNDYMSDRLSQPIQDLQELMRFCRVKLPCQYALWKESRIKPK